ncbi:unnamed protein product [Ectocarpus sp. 4 AP-2014]
MFYTPQRMDHSPHELERTEHCSHRSDLHMANRSVLLLPKAVKAFRQGESGAENIMVCATKELDERRRPSAFVFVFFASAIPTPINLGPKCGAPNPHARKKRQAV